jgi:hypothetical protein
MRSKLQRLGVGVCPAVACAAAVLMAGLILLLPPGVHRFAGKTSHQRASATVAHGTGGAAADKAEPGVRARAVESYGKLPLNFEVNKGQTDSRVKFLSRGSGYSLFLTGDAAVLALRKPVQKANGKGKWQKVHGSVGHPTLGLFRGCSDRLRRRHRVAETCFLSLRPLLDFSCHQPQSRTPTLRYQTT